MAIGDEIPESAKAIQEVAKTTKAGIEATEKFGGFISRIIGEPLDELSGILTDKLKYSRWERRQRLTERAKQFIEEKNIEGELRPVPPKIALPVIENASLEDNDELQDLWARLIASAVDPNFDGSLRTAFIDILKQLEVNDVHILSYIYESYLIHNKTYKINLKSAFLPDLLPKNVDSHQCPIFMREIIEKFGIDVEIYKESIDNLIRVGCVTSFVSDEEVDILKDNRPSHRSDDEKVYEDDFITTSETINFNINHLYRIVCITSLGVSFAKACMLPKSEEIEHA